MSLVTEALISMGKRLVMQKLMAVIAGRLPFLATGPIGWIVSAILGKFVTKILTFLFEAAEDGIVFLGIDIRVGSEHKEYIKAFAVFKEAKTKEEKKNAETKLDAAFDSFVDLN